MAYKQKLVDDVTKVSYTKEEEIPSDYRLIEPTFRSDERRIRPPELLEEKLEPKIKMVRVADSRVSFADPPLKPIERLSPEIFGTLFDRLDFVNARIAETTETMKSRDALHKQMVIEIDEDIKEKEAMEKRMSDIDGKRNLRLDISLLRKERRNEQVLFWRDLLELRTELRELLEKQQVETKLADLFRGLEGKGEVPA